MRPLRVLVIDVDAEHPLELASVEDQQPVETLGADGSDEALRDGVRLRRPHRRLHNPDALATRVPAVPELAYPSCTRAWLTSSRR